MTDSDPDNRADGDRSPDRSESEDGAAVHDVYIDSTDDEKEAAEHHAETQRRISIQEERFKNAGEAYRKRLAYKVKKPAKTKRAKQSTAKDPPNQVAPNQAAETIPAQVDTLRLETPQIICNAWFKLIFNFK